MGHPAVSTIAILSAWFVGLVNVEGVYRQKATAKIVATISITAMLLLANLVHGTLWLSALTTFLVMFAAGFVGILGQAAAAISLTISITFIVALARFAAFPDWSTVLQQCALCLAGGFWSTGLSIGLWQLHPYKPVTQAVAQCYRVLSQLVDAAEGRVANPDDRRAQLTRFLQTQDQFTQALTTARNRWSAAWTAQRAANLPGDQLLVLIEDTPLIANAIVTLVEQVVIASDHPFFQQSQGEVQRGLEQAAAVLQQMSVAIVNGQSVVHLEGLDRAIAALNPPPSPPHQSAFTHPKDLIASTSLNRIAATLTRLSTQLHADAALIATLRSGSASTTPTRRPASLPKTEPKQPILDSLLAALRNHLTVHSVLFRHALRLALVATTAEILAALLQIPRGYWITLTAVVALKPNYGGTSQMTLQRVLGTVLGGTIGIAIVTLIHNAWLIGGCLLLLIMTAVAVRPLSFSLFVTLLTPAIILLLNMTSHGGWEIGALRIADSLVGGLLALLGSYLLFPRWERQQLPVQVETTIRANLAYFQQVVALYFHPDRETAAIAPLRRQAALENTNLSASAQRLFSEPRHIQGNVEPITALIFYLRRFFNSVTALAESLPDVGQPHPDSNVKPFADAVIQILESLATTIPQRQLPLPLPDLDPILEAIHCPSAASSNSPLPTAALPASPPVQAVTPLTASLEQIAHEIRNIHSAVERLQP